MPSTSLDYLVALVLLVLSYCLWRAGTSTKAAARLPLPPGPKGVPVLGNALQIPKDCPWLVYADWAKQYGDLIHLSALGQHLMIINSWSIAHDLFEKRSALYSGRVHMTFAGDMVGWGKSVAMVEGARHTQTRRMGQAMMSLAAVQGRYGESMTSEAYRLLKNLLDSPEKYMEHYRSSAGAFIMLTTCGTAPGPEQDRLVDMAKVVVEHFSVAATPGNWVVDFIPLLKYVPSWMPGFSFNAIGKAWRIELETLVNSPFDKVRNAMATHTAPLSITSDLIEKNPDPKTEDVIRWLTGSLFAAGADTTVSALACFTLAMLRFPAAQRSAQAELDAVVGSDRLPSFSDMSRLPYLHALVREVLRWGVIVPMGFPHRVTSDDNYSGYYIPADTLLMPNTWAMSRDKTVYGDDVDVFRPERFLDMTTDHVRHQYGSAAFGFGPRVCLGQHVAFATLLIQIASIMAVFDVVPAARRNGEEWVPEEEVRFSSGVVSHPERFEAIIRPRSREAAELIQAANAFEV